MKSGVIITKPASNQFILQKRAIRIIYLNTNYKCHTKPLFYQLRSLNVFDIIDLNSLVFMYKAFHNSLPANLLSYFKNLMAAIIITHEIIISISKYDTEELLKSILKVFVSKVLKCGIPLVQTSS